MLGCHVAIDDAGSTDVESVFVHCTHLISVTVSGVVDICESPFVAAYAAPLCGCFYCLVVVAEVEAFSHSPLTCALCFHCIRNKVRGSGTVESACLLAFKKHHILLACLIPYYVCIYHIVAWIEIELRFAQYVKVFIHKRIIDAVSVWKSHTVIHHILARLLVVYYLWCPCCGHLTCGDASQCIQVLGCLKVYLHVLGPVHKVWTLHQHHNMVACPSQTRCHVGTGKHEIAICHTQHISISHATRHGVGLGVKDLCATEHIVPCVAILAEGIVRKLPTAVHVGIEIGCLVCILLLVCRV